MFLVVTAGSCTQKTNYALLQLLTLSVMINLNTILGLPHDREVSFNDGSFIVGNYGQLWFILHSTFAD